VKLAAALAAALAATAMMAAAPAAPAPRSAEKGCEWKLFTSAALGIEVPYQRCDFGYRVIDFAAGKRGLYQTMQDKGKKRDVYPVITVFDKKADEAPDEAIRRTAFKALSWYKRRHCAVVATHVAHLGLNKAAFTISPDAEYAAKAAKEAGTDIPEPPCGDQGESADSVSYFEFHPLENPRRFVFVSAGQDTPLFDDSAIRFLP
jgi:hypothetical protein